jgi:hypothetical protein
VSPGMRESASTWKWRASNWKQTESMG